MANNPLLGNRISLISKKDIRYEGTLYSINEADATVALADVRSYGTEGRETQHDNGSSSSAYVPPQDVVHPYLLFRGCDIKDLHVHEKSKDENVNKDKNGTPEDPAIVSTEVPEDLKVKQQQQHQKQTQTQQMDKEKETQEKKENVGSSNDGTTSGESAQTPLKGGSGSGSGTKDGNSRNGSYPPKHSKKSNGPPVRQSNGKNGYPRRTRKHENRIGFGASLLNRKARGVVGSEPTTGKDFDFESSAAEFNKEKSTLSPTENDPIQPCDAYNKNDFFDSISCDAIDKRDGVDNRLRGAAERSLNTETFGAVSLGSGRRGGRRYRGGGRAGGGRGRGGRGHGGGGEYGPPRENSRWKREEGERKGGSRGRFSQPYMARAGGER